MKLNQQVAALKTLTLRIFTLPVYYGTFFLPKTIVIDGGLGSQILGWIKYQITLETNSKSKVRLDTTYFYNQYRKNITPLTTLFEWELDQYGINLTEQKKNRFLEYFKFSYDQQAKLEKNLFELMKAKNWSSYFPLSIATESLKNDLGIMSEYCVVHLRRGDYLKVATRVLGVGEVLQLLCKIQHLIPRDVVLISDSELETGNFEEVKRCLPRKNIQLLVGRDPHAVHGLMRESSLLIASNSTFSLSAGLTMSRGGVVIFPKDFHGPKRKRINANFNELADWNIL
jgi:hypothetical protein